MPEEEKANPEVVPVETLNSIILELIKSYPLGGGYYWPKDGTSDGVTRELWYRDVIVARPRVDKKTYCCGLTFEVYLRACEEFMQREKADGYRIDNLSVAELKRMKSDWFVATGIRTGPVDALVPRGVGMNIPRQQAEAGDFAQLWRKNGSGHSVVVLKVSEDSIHYWTTQTGTDGIGERTEYFSGGEKPVTELYIARALVPTTWKLRSADPGP